MKKLVLLIFLLMVVLLPSCNKETSEDSQKTQGNEYISLSLDFDSEESRTLVYYKRLIDFYREGIAPPAEMQSSILGYKYFAPTGGLVDVYTYVNKKNLKGEWSTIYQGNLKWTATTPKKLRYLGNIHIKKNDLSDHQELELVAIVGKGYEIIKTNSNTQEKGNQYLSFKINNKIHALPTEVSKLPHAEVNHPWVLKTRVIQTGTKLKQEGVTPKFLPQGNVVSVILNNATQYDLDFQSITFKTNIDRELRLDNRGNPSFHDKAAPGYVMNSPLRLPGLDERGRPGTTNLLMLWVPFLHGNEKPIMVNFARSPHPYINYTSIDLTDHMKTNALATPSSYNTTNGFGYEYETTYGRI